MRNKIKHSKKIPINHVDIKETDVLQFAKFIEKIFMKGDYKKEFSVFFDDDSTISGDSIEVFQNDEFQRKKTIKIYMEYYSNSLESHLIIELYHTGNYNLNSEMRITSTDDTWYNSTVNSLYEILKGIHPQSKLAALADKPYALIIQVMSTSFISMLLVSMFFDRFPMFNEYVRFMFFSFIAACLGFLFSQKLFDNIEEIYPKVNLDFGPQHKNRGQRKKDFWSDFIKLIIIPLIFLLIGWLMPK